MFAVRSRRAGLTLPSVVTAAKTVDEYGDQATSPTAALRSKVNMGCLVKKKNHTHKELMKALMGLKIKTYKSANRVLGGFTVSPYI